MLLTEEQTRYYLTDMINHYGEKQNKAESLSWTRSEAEYKKKAFEDMRIVLFGDEDNGHRNKST
jgi:hypothetical protein